MNPGVNVFYFHEAGNAFSLGTLGWLTITNTIFQEKMETI